MLRSPRSGRLEAWPPSRYIQGMKIFGLSGWSGSGKTTLLAKLIPELVRRGVRVSTLKHAHHEFDVDKPGKDSYVHREAGATEVLISSGKRFALMHELRGAPEQTVEELVARMSPVDLVLIEGFKAHAHDKLEVHRAELGKPPRYPEDPRIVAVASDGPLPGLKLPRLDLNDVPAIADFVMRHCGLVARNRAAE
jgi:molybdopterin-guanine dinucleotide biosynthesis adapter protein